MVGLLPVASMALPSSRLFSSRTGGGGGSVGNAGKHDVQNCSGEEVKAEMFHWGRVRIRDAILHLRTVAICLKTDRPAAVAINVGSRGSSRRRQRQTIAPHSAKCHATSFADEGKIAVHSARAVSPLQLRAFFGCLHTAPHIWQMPSTQTCCSLPQTRQMQPSQ